MKGVLNYTMDAQSSHPTAILFIEDTRGTFNTETDNEG